MELKFALTPDELNEYLSGQRNNVYYQESITEYKKFEVHASGSTPTELIHERRPSESQEVLDYRKKIYESKTKTCFTKVWNSLNKIRRSSDWGFSYPELNEFTLIREGETIKDYLEFNFPSHKSVTTWAFAELLRQYLIDPNGVVFIKPESTNIQENDFLKPIPLIFNSEFVLDYVEGNYALLKNPEGVFYINKEGKLTKGESYYFITTLEIIKYNQTNGEKDFKIETAYPHKLGILPVIKMKGALLKRTENYAFYESRIAGMIPELNEAAREYSDLQASLVTSAFAERWEYSQTQCTHCEGTGTRVNPKYFDDPKCTESPTLQCEVCKGRAYTVSGPFSKIMVTPASSTDLTNQVPTPPAGYIQKDVEIIKLQDASVDKHLYSALAAINFQFLDQSPLNVSGKKTEIDKDELNNTVHGVAEDIVAVIDYVNKCVAYYRYSVVYPDRKVIDKMLPQVPVPQKFDLIGSTGMVEEIKQVKDSSMNPVIKNAYEIDFANKKFYDNPEVGVFTHLVLSLDPLPNQTQDEKFTALSNKGITLNSFVLSCNIVEFIRKALDEDENFPELEREKQLDKLYEYAEAVVTENNEVSKISTPIANANMNGLEGEESATNGEGQPGANPSEGKTDDTAADPTEKEEQQVK